jgi:hypothetical protein
MSAVYTAMASHLDPSLFLSLVLGVLEVLVCLGVLHAGVGRAMRARGVTPWRVRETALVSPLLLVGLLVFFFFANHGMLRYALDGRGGAAGITHAVETTAAAVTGLVMAWFGARAVGKLY